MKVMISTVLAAVAVFAGSAVAQQQQATGTAQYCIKGASGPAKCEFHTMAHCEKAKTGSSDQCIPRSQVESTVGGPTPSSREQPSAPGQQKD
jgi:hypothetical protein